MSEHHWYWTLDALSHAIPQKPCRFELQDVHSLYITVLHLNSIVRKGKCVFKSIKGNTFHIWLFKTKFSWPFSCQFLQEWVWAFKIFTIDTRKLTINMNIITGKISSSIDCHGITISLFSPCKWKACYWTRGGETATVFSILMKTFKFSSMFWNTLIWYIAEQSVFAVFAIMQHCSVMFSFWTNTTQDGEETERGEGGGGGGVLQII